MRVFGVENGRDNSKLTANIGIPVCLFRELWRFKVFTGKAVTPLHEKGNSLQFRAGKKATHFHYKWFMNGGWTDFHALNVQDRSKMIQETFLASLARLFRVPPIRRDRGLNSRIVSCLSSAYGIANSTKTNEWSFVYQRFRSIMNGNS